MFHKVTTSEGIEFPLCDEGLRQVGMCLETWLVPPVKLDRTKIVELADAYYVNLLLGLPVDKITPHIEDIKDANEIEII
jgi:hypothetical protein